VSPYHESSIGQGRLGGRGHTNKTLHFIGGSGRVLGQGGGQTRQNLGVQVKLQSIVEKAIRVSGKVVVAWRCSGQRAIGVGVSTYESIVVRYWCGVSKGLNRVKKGCRGK